MELEKKDFEFLQPMINQGIENYFKQKEKADFEKKIFNITQTAEIMGKTYNFVAGLMRKGYLKTTLDGKHLTGAEINNYLQTGNTD